MIVIVHLLSLGWYLYWWTITITKLIPLLVDYYYHYVDTSTGGLLLSLGWYIYQDCQPNDSSSPAVEVSTSNSNSPPAEVSTQWLQ
jgi:hypothetical protein